MQLEEWMTKMHSSLVKLDECTCNLQLLKDSLKRKDWIDAERVGLFDFAIYLAIG